jgi:DNA-binding transcriptional ArsR family regulator
MEVEQSITASTFLVSSWTLNEIDEAVRKAMSNHLSWVLLTMLHEAPGHARDIAFSLDIAPETVEHELNALSDQELVITVREAEDCWYRLADRRVADCISAHHPPGSH